MSSYPELLTGARFYGAKSEEITHVEVLDSRPLEQFRLEILSVERDSGSDLYQVLVDASVADVLAGPGASAYVQGLAKGLVGEVHGTLPLAGPVTPITGEQSNTSLIAGNVMVKAFRKLEAGLNPDVELLSKIGDCPNVAAVHGWVTRQINGRDYTLAMVQDLVEGGCDGWDLALEFAREGRSFAAEAELLGAAIRTVHEALASAFGTTDTDARQSLQDHLVDLEQRNEEVAGVAKQARHTYAALPDTPVAAQRIHGDLHLGQVLRTEQDYVLIDFEGEPARPLEQRRAPDSPLRDVAGMLRSIDYAANFADGAPAGWADEASEALLRGYGVKTSPLLDAYVLDKALYEVIYEADNRPDWIHLPLKAVNKILAT